MPCACCLNPDFTGVEPDLCFSCSALFVGFVHRRGFVRSDLRAFNLFMQIYRKNKSIPHVPIPVPPEQVTSPKKKAEDTRGLCEKCRENRPLTKHHVFPVRMRPLLHAAGSIKGPIAWLCRSCHDKAESHLDQNIVELFKKVYENFKTQP